MATGEAHHGVFAFAQETFSPELSNLRGDPVISHPWQGMDRRGMVPELRTTQFSQISFARHRDYELFEEQREEVESESPSFEYSIDSPRGDLNHSLTRKRPRYEGYWYDKGDSSLEEDYHVESLGIENANESQSGRDKLRMNTEALDPARKKRRHTKPLTIADLLLANGIPVADDSHDNEDKDGDIGNGPVNLQGLVDEDGLTTSTWQHRWRGRITRPLTYAELFLANRIAFKGAGDKYDEEKGERNVNESISSVTTRCGRKTKPPKRFRRSGPTLAKANSKV